VVFFALCEEAETGLATKHTKNREKQQIVNGWPRDLPGRYAPGSDKAVTTPSWLRRAKKGGVFFASRKRE
jgi:hypothetical protein